MNLQLVETRGQQALTNSLVVAEHCGITHQAALKLVRKYQADFEEFGLLGFEIRPRSAGQHGGGDVEIVILNEDQATYLITMFRNTPTVRRFKRALVKAFRKALNEIARLYANPPRADILKAKRLANRPMMDALVEAREEVGKATDERHYMSESKLCNWAVLGHFAKIDEKALSNEDAALLEWIRDRNRAYIIAGLDYETRKQRLAEFAIRRRTKQLTAPTRAAPGSAPC